MWRDGQKGEDRADRSGLCRFQASLYHPGNDYDDSIGSVAVSTYMFGSKKSPRCRWSDGEGMKWWLRLGADLFNLSSPSPIMDWPGDACIFADRGTLRAREWERVHTQVMISARLHV